MHALVVINYGSGTVSTILMKYISKQKMKRILFTSAELNLFQEMVKSGYVKLAELLFKGQKFPNCQLRIKQAFLPLPPELQFYSMEERLIAMRIVFMLLRDHPVGGQTFVRGNFVNVPVDIAPTVNTLPRYLNESEIVTIKFKRKIQYKRCEFKENIRPMVVWKALSYLLKESPLYKEANIQVDTSWLDNMYNLIDDDRELVTQSTHNDSDFEIENKN